MCLSVVECSQWRPGCNPSPDFLLGGPDGGRQESHETDQKLMTVDANITRV